MSESYMLEDQKLAHLLPDRSKQFFVSQSTRDYYRRDLGTNSSIYVYMFPREQKTRYEDLKNLIKGWLEEPGDYDTSVWPEIEKNLANQKIAFRETFD